MTPGHRACGWRLALAGVVCLVPGIASADACRDDFVACVTETGNVPECSSISRACTLGATGEQLDTREIEAEPTLFGRAGKRWIRVTVRNPNPDAVELTNHTEDLTCADGSSFTAHFRFAGRILKGAEQIESAPQIVCPGADLADGADANERRDRPSTSARRYACDPDDAAAPVYTLSRGQGGRIEARSGPVRVVYDLSGGTAEALFAMLCEDGHETAERSNEMLVLPKGLLDEILPPEPTCSIQTRTVSTGPRN